MNQDWKPWVERALTIAMEAHRTQVDRYGEPYVLHVLRVGLAGLTAGEQIAGFLHDVVEDCPEWTLSGLRDEGFPEEIVQAVDHLTKRQGEAYEDFIQRAVGHPLARKVKLNDLKDNLNLLRVKGGLDGPDIDRLNRYLRAVQACETTV